MDDYFLWILMRSFTREGRPSVADLEIICTFGLFLIHKKEKVWGLHNILNKTQEHNLQDRPLDKPVKVPTMIRISDLLQCLLHRTVWEPPHQTRQYVVLTDNLFRKGLPYSNPFPNYTVASHHPYFWPSLIHRVSGSLLCFRPFHEGHLHFG